MFESYLYIEFLSFRALIFFSLTSPFSFINANEMPSIFSCKLCKFKVYNYFYFPIKYPFFKEF